MLFFVHSLILFINFIECGTNRKEDIIINLLGQAFFPLLSRAQLLSVLNSGEQALDPYTKTYLTQCHLDNFPLLLRSLIKILEKVDERKLLTQSVEFTALELASLLVGLIRSDININEIELDILNFFMAFLIRLHDYDPDLTILLVEFRWEFRIRKYKLSHYGNLGLYLDPGLKVGLTLRQSFEDLRLAVGVPNAWNFGGRDNLYENILRNTMLVRYINRMNAKYGLFTSSSFHFYKVVRKISSDNPARDKLFRDVITGSLRVHFLRRDSIRFETIRPYNQTIEFNNSGFRVPPILKGLVKHIVFSPQNLSLERAKFLHTIVMFAISEFFDSIYCIYELFYNRADKFVKVNKDLDLRKEFQINFDLIFESVENDESMQLLKSYLIKILNLQMFFMSNCNHDQHLPNLLFLENFNSELSSQSIEYQIREYLWLMPVWMGFSIKRSPLLNHLLFSNSKNEGIKNLISFIHFEIALAFRIFSVLENKSGAKLGNSGANDHLFFSEEDTFTFATFSLLCWIINE